MGAAHAEDGPTPDVDAGNCQVQRFCVGVGVKGSSDGKSEQVSTTGGSESKLKCKLTELDPPPPADHPVWQGADPKKGKLYFRACSDGALNNPDGFIFVPNGEPVPQVDPAELAQRAVDSMKLAGPDINIAPKPTGKGVVGMPVWMAVNQGATTWGPNTASATAGGVTVTATAKVGTIVWAMGDGTKVTCTGPGKVYEKSYGWKTSPDCGHVYRQPSSGQLGGKYTVTATATWTIDWQVVGGGGESGQLTEVRDSEVQLTIVESQAVN